MNVYECALVIADGIAETHAVGAAIELQVERVIGTQTVGGSGITDGDKGDVTVSGSGTVWTVDARAITAGKLFEVGATKLLGRHTGTAGDVQEISVDGGLEFHGGQLRRAALTGAVTAAAGSGTTTLAQNGAATGNYYKWDGANWVPAPISYLEDIEDIPATFPPAAHTHTLSNLTQSGATTGQVAQWNGTAWVPATASGGAVLKVACARSTSSGSTTVVIPLDNTIPQNTEGAELMTLAFTPTSASSRVMVIASFWYTSHVNTPIAALFFDADLNATRSTVLNTVPTLHFTQQATAVFDVPSWAGEKTLRLRAGPNFWGGTSAFFWNQLNTGGVLGGTSIMTLTAMEYMP
jgi:hypothetical protein